MAAQKPTILLIGNPGTGKSTILNSLAKKVLFKSGVSIATGLTTVMQVQEADNFTLIDTPGLEDIKTREKASEEITEALKQRPEIKIIFVCTLESGRVRPSDLTTMQLVLESVTTPSPFEYGIIINKIPKNTVTRLQDAKNKSEYQALFAGINEGHRPTNKILLLVKDGNLEDADGALITDISDIAAFISILPPALIQKEQVGKIKVDVYEKLRVEMESKIDELRKDNQLLQKKIQEYEKPGFWDTVGQSALRVGTWGHTARPGNDQSTAGKIIGGTAGVLLMPSGLIAKGLHAMFD